MKSKEIKALERTIWELRKEAEFQTRRHLLECDGVRAKEQAKFYENTINLERENCEIKAKNAEIEERWDNSIQKQQADLIKALCVKLPTVNIKEIHADCKGK